MTDFDPAQTRVYPGLCKGFVRDTDDPEGRGRIRCFCPQVMGPTDSPDFWLGWAEPCLPWLGGVNTLDFGVPYTRGQNDQEDVPVWLMFEGGDPEFPVWMGFPNYAPTKDDTHTQIDPSATGGRAGGSLLDSAASAGPGTENVDQINPPQMELGAQEIVLMAKKGRRIKIGVAGGGYIVLGPDGVNNVGIFVRMNGKLVEASLTEIVGLWAPRSKRSSIGRRRRSCA